MSDFGNGVLRGMTSVERVGDQVLLTGTSSFRNESFDFELIRREEVGTGHYSKSAVVCDVPQEARELTKDDRRGRDGFEGFDDRDWFSSIDVDLEEDRFQIG